MTWYFHYIQTGMLPLGSIPFLISRRKIRPVSAFTSYILFADANEERILRSGEKDAAYGAMPLS